MGFRYLGNSNGRIKLDKRDLKLGLKISFIAYISGSNGVLRRKKAISLLKPTF